MQGPYQSPSKVRGINARDKKTVTRFIKRLFRTSARLTKDQIVMANWWEIKFASLALFLPFFQRFGPVTGIESTRIAVSESLAQHDAILVAWKEKRRHDLVRPTTVIRRLFRKQRVRAFRGFSSGVGSVRADEWEPVIPIQPHPEFPSASAVLCQATLDHLQSAVQDLLGNAAVPPVQIFISNALVPNVPVDVNMNLTFQTLDDAAKSCGFSRLYAVVHFEPSVTAGFELAKGIGEKAFLQMKEIYAGRVPDSCTRCTRSQ